MWKFTFYGDDAGEWRWRLKGANGEIVGQGEGHPRLADATRAAENFKAKVGQAQIVRPKIARPRRNVAAPPARVPLLDALVAQSRRSQETTPR